MNTDELEAKWKSITYTGSTPYRSLRISADCKPELYLALDFKSHRYLILQVPLKTHVSCKSVEMENLSIEWHEDSRLILIGLRNQRFSDLFNDLTISLYNKIKDTVLTENYTSEFISGFHKWAEFFEDSASSQLSEFFIKGLFGELTVLLWSLNNNAENTPDRILSAWQGPYNRSQDFIFPAYNLEVKTKDTDEVNIHISSEYQLEPEVGKGLLLGVVNVIMSEDGTTLHQMIITIRNVIISKGADLSVFIKALSRLGLNISNTDQYDMFKWQIASIILYDATGESFPKITNSQIRSGISQVKYNLNLSVLNSFIIQTINF